MTLRDLSGWNASPIASDPSSIITGDNPEGVLKEVRPALQECAISTSYTGGNASRVIKVDRLEHVRQWVEGLKPYYGHPYDRSRECDC